MLTLVLAGAKRSRRPTPFWRAYTTRDRSMIHTALHRKTAFDQTLYLTAVAYYSFLILFFLIVLQFAEHTDVSPHV